MDHKYRGQLEINDLIDDAVNNAIARRSQIDSESALSELSDEEVRNVAGGQIIKNPICPPIIAGMIICPPITVGLIAVPDDKTFKIQAFE